MGIGGIALGQTGPGQVGAPEIAPLQNRQSAQLRSPESSEFMSYKRACELLTRNDPLPESRYVNRDRTCGSNGTRCYNLGLITGLAVSSTVLLGFGVYEILVGKCRTKRPQP